MPTTKNETPLPDNVTDLADLAVCETCGQTYDRSWADQAFFHASGHVVVDAPHARGIRIDPADIPPAPPPIPGACNAVSIFGDARCEVRPGEHVKLPNGALEHRSGVRTFVIMDMTEEPEH